MSSSCLMLGMMALGIWEILLILGLLIGFASAVALGVVFLTTALARKAEDSAPSSSPASTVRPGVCPRCGGTLSSDAPQGLCPRCVLQVGIGTEDASEPAFRDASGKPNPPDPAELARHFPQLEIIELLGQGGMGAVYKARQKDLDRIVALKVLPAGNGRDPAFAERFMREARALAKLNHPNIVAVHDFGQIQRSEAAFRGEAERRRPVAAASASGLQDGGKNAAGGTPALLYYFVMEFIDGPNLRQLMQTRRLEPREAMSIVPRICEALQYAHDEGIVHRDIKPENILLDTKGRVKIADFGIAKIAGKGRDGTLTGAKDVIGTPHYMAPEQVEKPQTVDHRADIYSLGVVFYEMLTGELPLGKFEVPSRKVQVDVRLDEVVLHSLEKEPARRYQHASEVKTDVETIAGAPSSSPPPTRHPAVAQSGNVWQVKSVLLFVAAACFVVAGVLFASSGNGTAAVLSTVAVIGFSVAGYRHLAGGVAGDASHVSPAAAQEAQRPGMASVHPKRTAWFAPLMVLRRGRRVVHWPGVVQDTFLLAGIYAICWLLAVLLLSPIVGTPHVAALFGGMLGFLAAMLAMGFHRSSKTPTNRLRNVDSPPDGGNPRRGRWQPIAAALLLVGCVLLWGWAGFVTYVLPMIVERLASQDAELPRTMQFILQVGTVARGFEVVLVPLLVLATAGSLVWLFISSTQPPRQTRSPSQGGESNGSRILKGMGLIAAQWTARILGTLLLLFYGTFIVAEGLPPIAAQSVGVQLNFIALGLMLGGFAVGWKREGTAALLISAGWTLWHISEGRIDLNLFQTPLPVAALYAYCWWELRGRRTGLLVGTVAGLAVALAIGRFALPVNVFVTGTIADAATGAGISNADLTIVRPSEVDRPGDDLPNARSGAEGRYRLHLGWYDAQQPLRITAPGYAALTTNLGPREPGHRRVSRHYELAAFTAAREATTMPDTIPPVVLQTLPESGSSAVDPTLTELRVTFSKPMRDGNWSWVDLGDGSFPEMTGEPRYLEDRRTCVLPVKLEPGRTYATWINVDQFTSFQNEDGTPAVPYLLIFETRK